MGFCSLRVYNFRNLENETIDTDSPEVFLVGDNGQGKTNFLEALYILCFGSSFRTRNEELLKRFGEPIVQISCEYLQNKENQFTVSVLMEEKEKKIFFNGKRILDRKELISNIPCIVFCHNDIDFVTGPPERRRWFFNQVICMNEPFFINSLREYQKILLTRNRILKEGPMSLLDIYDQQLVEKGLEIQEKREKTIGFFNDIFTPLYKRISNLSKYDLKISYMPSFGNPVNRENLLKFLKTKRDSDLQTGISSLGPHRDRFSFSLNGRNFIKTASTGQARLVSLSLRVSQANYIHKKTGLKPILLLDDVLLELDGKKRILFLDSLPEYEQAFFTFLPEEPYKQYLKKDTKILYTSKGTFRAEK